MNCVDVTCQNLKPRHQSQTVAASISAGGETYKVYKTDSDTLLISREDALNQKEDDLHSSGSGETPSLLNGDQLAHLNSSKTTSTGDCMPISNRISFSCSNSNPGFSDIDDDLCSLKTLLSFRVDNVVPSISNTELDKEVTAISDSLSLYKQSQMAESNTNLAKNGQNQDSILAIEPKTNGTCDKPPYHYSDLIEFALVEKNMLPVNGIYEWIKGKFPYFRTLEESRWKPAIRHTLTTNSNFVKAKKAHRGYMWAYLSEEERKQQSVKWTSTQNQNHWKKQKLAEYENSKGCTMNRPEPDMHSKVFGNSNSLLKSSQAIVTSAEDISDMDKYYRKNCPISKCYNMVKPDLSQSLKQDKIAKTSDTESATTVSKNSGFYVNNRYDRFGLQTYSDRLLPALYKFPDKQLPKRGAHQPHYFMPSRAYLNPVPQDVALEESGLSPPNSHTVSAVPSSSSIGASGSEMEDFGLENLLPVQPSGSQSLLT